MAASPADHELLTELACEEIDRRNIIGRIWRRDHTVWNRDPDEIANRLGWLNVSSEMRATASTIRRFADRVHADGFDRVALLGMGGSSLGPEALARTFGSADGFPGLSVLDSVLPSEVRAASNSIDPSRTLFLVSSKSGTTVETNSLYSYFRREVDTCVGPEAAGNHFAAITDRGTPLARLAVRDGFRRLFLNPTDIGGRYSVQSLVGLVPGALMGLDLEAALDQVDAMADRCSANHRASDNPGARLGAAIAAQAVRGQDKLTLLVSSSVAAFAPWAEQLVAESLGKEGKGVVPVVEEPLARPARPGADRQFVYLRLRGDENAALDSVADTAARERRPLVALELGDRNELWGEFFRWEFAVAVAGALLSVNPFDQPDVELSKRMTRDVLDGAADVIGVTGNASPAELLAGLQPGDYLGILAYVRRTSELHSALAGLRRAIGETHGIATTVGYGPRYLHSTGQLHKGGPVNGRFLQLVERSADGCDGDVEVPGAGYSFGQLARAQADGDLGALAGLGRSVSRVCVEGTGAEEVTSLAASLRRRASGG